MKLIFTNAGRWLKKVMLFSMMYSRKKLIMRIGIFNIFLLLFGTQLVMSNTVNSQTLETIQITVVSQHSNLQSLFKEIERQTDLLFAFQLEQIAGYQVNLDDEHLSVKDALDMVLKDTPLSYRQVNNNVLIFLSQQSSEKEGQIPNNDKSTLLQPALVQGKVTDENGNAIYGVTVLIKGTTSGVITDEDGNFSIEIPANATLVFSFIGMEKQEITIPAGKTKVNVIMQKAILELDEVEIVSTGYKEMPKERETGSFTLLDNKILNRSVSTDILSRIENIAPGLLFDRRFNGSPSISIRGQSTIASDETPLIVVDNFPYEGSIDNINPNDIESISVLKDAAAASIWGVRAGNGVIVITTKKGHFQQPMTIQANANVTIRNKPDLFYNPQFLNSSDFIDVEQYLFDQDYYSWMEGYSTHPAMSPVVQLLVSRRDGLVSDSEAEAQLDYYRKQDVRNDFSKYFYRTSINQQYSLSLKGGSETVKYYFSGGFDGNDNSLVRNGLDRVTLNSMLSYHPSDKLEVTSSLTYTNSKQTWNNSGIGSITSGGTYGIYPYAELADDNGNPLAIVRDYNTDFVEQAEANGLLDWSYRPLQDLNANDYSLSTGDIRINTGIKYSFNNWLNVEGRYQFEQQNQHTRQLQSTKMYYTRNLINQYTYTDEDDYLQFPVPKGSILDNSYSDIYSHAGRFQLNFNKNWNDVHRLYALAGVEIRQMSTKGFSSRIYGYNDDLLTFSSIDYETNYLITPDGYTSSIPNGDFLNDLIDRNRSYYGNFSYTYLDRYTISASARKDESNLFGVDANNKGVPLWSAGLGWKLSSEQFFPFQEWLPLLKIRATYGYSGNVNKSLTAYATGYYYNNSYTNLPYIQILTPPNPNLRWEKIRMINLGLDFESKNHLLSGSIEYYDKKGMDLIGRASLDPTAGFAVGGRNEYIGNNSALEGQGLDIQLNLDKTFGKVNWTVQLFYSHTTNEITRYDYESSSISAYFSSVPVPVPGNPRYSLYSLEWAGLDPENGDPQIYMSDEITKDYGSILSNLTLDDLICEGSALPTSFGSLRQNFRLGDFSIGFNISYKFGYYFRRPSLSYSDLFNSWIGHEEFSKRWLNPGDEESTQVPSMPAVGTSSIRDFIYTNANINVEKGDHIRFQDINVSYDLLESKYAWLPFNKVTLYGYINNIGILWRANKGKIDPDYIYQSYPASQSYSFGINLSF